MGDFLPSLLSFPPEKQVSAKEYDKQATAFVKELVKLSESTWLKTVNKQNILDLLNPTTNTLPYLFALNAQFRNVGKDKVRTEDAYNRSVLFFTSFDQIQIRYAGDAFLRLLELCFELYPKLGVHDYNALSTAMLRLDPTAGTFTSSHLRLVRLCLASGVPSQALPILNKNIYAFPQAPAKNQPDELLCEDHERSNSFITSKSGFSLPIKSEYVLEYYLLGAHIYIGLRNYKRARLFLECLILTPTPSNTCSALQSEAYKKWILVGLLARGKCYSLPRTHNQQVMKSMKAVSKAYDALAETFEKREYRKFQAETQAGMQIWHDDGNMRLVKEAGDALLRFRVIDLQKTYKVMYVSTVAKLLGGMSFAETMALLNDMMDEGHLDASFGPMTADCDETELPDGRNTVLYFDGSAPEASNVTTSANRDLETHIQSLVTSIRDADRRLQLTKEYVEVQKRTKRGAAGPDGDLADQMDLTWDPPITGEEDDEDIMS